MEPNLGYMNFGNQTYNQNQYGGYPYGYPSSMPLPSSYESQYSPFIQNPMPQTPQDIAAAAACYPQQGYSYIPGSVAPIQAQMSDGNVISVQNPVYNQGGTVINQGGYNPATGTITQPSGISGCTKDVMANPYVKFAGAAVHNPELTNQNGYGFYRPQYQVYNQQYNSGYMRPYNYGIGLGYAQNQFDTELNEILYNEEPSIVDIRACLADIVLSDEEKEKIDHNRSNYIVGTDYYGRPIYAQTAYQVNQQRQEELEKARLAYQTHFTRLSRIAHAYTGEKFDEQKVMERFDPIPKTQPVKQFNYYTASPEEKKEYERNQAVYRCAELEYQMNMLEKNRAVMDQQRAMMFQKIKDSHDKLIGVEPGQHYDLRTYLDNAYKLCVNIEMEKAKSRNRNGSVKYCGNQYRATLANRSNNPVPITSKDNEYVSIEQLLKQVYDNNVAKNSQLMSTPNGGTIYGTLPPAWKGEEIAHQSFMNAVQEKKERDDIRKVVG